jgi:probable HAF family extracellular repeat protein
VIGSSSTGEGEKAFLWENGVMTNLGTLDRNHSESTALDINHTGQVVGFSGYFAGPYSAFLVQDDTMVRLESLEGSAFAQGINSAAQVVGYSDTRYGAGQYRAVLWENGTVTELELLSEKFGSQSAAYAINDSSQIVGWASGGAGIAAVMWVGRFITDLGTLGGTRSVAYAINNHGQVVGRSNIMGDDGRQWRRAFLWQKGTIMRNLGTLGGAHSVAHGINDHAQVVGEANDTGGFNRAFLWADGEMTDLNELIDPGSGWILERALDINNEGRIVGVGVHNGARRAFLLVPTTP